MGNVNPNLDVVLSIGIPLGTAVLHQVGENLREARILDCNGGGDITKLWILGFLCVGFGNGSKCLAVGRHNVFRAPSWEVPTTAPHQGLHFFVSLCFEFGL